MSTRARIICSLLSLITIAASAHAQIVKGSFVGTAIDQTGGVIPGIRVTVTNLETNVTTRVETDAAGTYIASFLDPGFYSVDAELDGFKSVKEPRVKLDIAARVRIDFTMEVGTSSEVVTVSTAAPLLQADSATVGLVVTKEKLERMPLIGRNYQELAQLAPTAVAPTISNMGIFKSGTLTAGGYFQVGGQRGSYIAYTTDGVDNQDVWWQSQAVIPPLDTIEEFNVQTSNFSAEYGRGTVQFTTTTKQGTNTLRGTAYGYFQNERLNANGFFENQANAPKAPFRDQQYGVTAGGPVRLPGLYDGTNRSFFFFGYSGRRHREDRTGFAAWPEPEWLQGDFSNLTMTSGAPQMIYDPATTRPDGMGGFTRDPFPGNVIPRDRIDPVALAVTPYILAPNARGLRPGVNYVAETDVDQDVNQWVARLDHALSPGSRLYGRYMQSTDDGTFTALAPLSGRTVKNNGANLMIGETHVLSDRLVNELRVGFSHVDYLPFQDGSGGSINYTKDLGIQNLTTNPRQFGLPNFGWSGYSGIGGQADAPLGGETNTLHLSDNVVISSGNHSIKTGFDVRYTRFTQIAGFGSRGSFGFSNTFTSLPGSAATTGSPFADFLLGISSSASGLFGDTEARLRGLMYGVYLQDDWRISRNLTLNLGLRYENYRPWTERDGKISRFDFGMEPGSCFGTGCAAGQFIPTGPGEPWYETDDNNWGPRLGMAYTPFGDRETVVRAAYGLFYSPTDMNEYVNGVFNPPNALSFSVAPQNLFTDVTTTKLSNLFPGGVLPPRDAVLSTDAWTLPAISPYPYLLSNRDAEVHQWQLSVQRSAGASTVLELGYIGSRGFNGQRRINYNQSRLDAPGELTPVVSRAPYPSLGVFTANDHSAKTAYDAGYVRAERRFVRGLSLVASYTLAKTMDDSGNADPPAQNAYDKDAEWGLSLFDARHRFTLGYVWELPIGRGRRLGTNLGPVADALIGGWQVAGVITLQSGSPFNLFPCCIDRSNTGQYFFALRPDINGPVEYLDIRETGMHFDPSVFSVPDVGTFGNAARGVTVAPGINNWDMSLSKHVRFATDKSLQFRVELFNALNHAQFTNPFPQIGAGLAQMGRVTGTRPPRRIQLGLRFAF